MKRRLAPTLAVFILLGPAACAASGPPEGPPASPAPGPVAEIRPPAHPAVPTDHQSAQWRRDAVLPGLRPLLDTRWAKEFLGGPELAPLQRALAQAPGAMPPPGSDAPGDGLALTLGQSLEIALQRNLPIRIAALSADAQAHVVDAALAKFHPAAGVSARGSGDSTAREAELTEAQLSAFISQEVPTGGRLVLQSDLSRLETRPSDSPEEFGSLLKLSVVQPVLRGGRVFVATREIQEARFDLRAGRARLAAEILRIIAETKRAYYNTLLSERVIEVTQAAIDRDRTLIEATEALFRAGLVTRRDVFSAELALATDSARLVSAQGNLELARNALLDVLGLPIGTRVALLDRDIEFEPLTVDLSRWIATATRERPEILALNERVAKSELNVRVTRHGLLPQLDFVAAYGRGRLESTFGRSLSLSGQVWEVGLVFSVPIGDVAANARLRQAEIEHLRLQHELTQAKRQIEVEVRATVIKLQTSAERTRILTTAIEHAKRKLEVARARFALGEATNFDITDAQEALLNAETDRLTAIVDHSVGLAELAASVGGRL